MRRVKHLVEYWLPTASTNNAECFFSVMRRAEHGIYHHIAGRYFEAYANEVAWRQDRRLTDTKAVFEELCASATALLVSRAVKTTKQKPVEDKWEQWKADFARATSMLRAKKRDERRKKREAAIAASF